MPNSRHRHKGHHHAHPQTVHPHTVKAKPKRSAATLMAIFIGVFGLAAGAFFSRYNVMWIVVGAAIGAVTGYLIGSGIDRTFAKK